MRSVPFSRFNTLMSVMVSLMGGPVGLSRDLALAHAGGYHSRGKGHGKVTYASSGTVAQAKRAAVKAKNRAKHRRACK